MQLLVDSHVFSHEQIADEGGGFLFCPRSQA